MAKVRVHPSSLTSLTMGTLNLVNGQGQGAPKSTDIVPEKYADIVRKFVGPVSDEEIKKVPQIGNSPTMVSVKAFPDPPRATKDMVSDLQYAEILAHPPYDKEEPTKPNQHKSMVQPSDILAHPPYDKEEHKTMVQPSDILAHPPYDKEENNYEGKPFYIVHLTYPMFYTSEGNLTTDKNESVWGFDKRVWGDKAPPRNLTPPPANVASVNKFASLIINMMNEATASIPCWDQQLRIAALQIPCLLTDTLPSTDELPTDTGPLPYSDKQPIEAFAKEPAESNTSGRRLLAAPTVRLVGGSSNSQGRVEVYKDGQWGTVCDDMFDSNTNAAKVVCRQLGLPWTDARVDTSVTGNAGLEILMDEVRCGGSESSLLDCSHVSKHDCDHTEDVEENNLPRGYRLQCSLQVDHNGNGIEMYNGGCGKVAQTAASMSAKCNADSRCKAFNVYGAANNGCIKTESAINRDPENAVQCFYTRGATPGPTPSPDPAPTGGSDALSRHNLYRSRHHAPSMQWSSIAESSAQAWANTMARECNMYHGGHPGMGQNLATNTHPWTWTGVIDAWYNEVSNYRCG
eukprot:gene29535-5881_t